MSRHTSTRGLVIEIAIVLAAMLVFAIVKGVS
jgi:hypothetical protein